MKKLAILSIGLLLSSGFWQSQTAEAMPNFQINFQIFYNELSPYGDWVQDPTYGFVWIPWVNQGFQPYLTNGHWTMTNFGNTWVSHYPWGWAPFHYGRWFWSDFNGWAWIPGYEWGPSWVSWRSGGGFFGWAPLGPSFGVGFNYGIAAHHWVFIPQRRFRARHFHRYCVPFNQVNLIYNRTTFINNTIVYNNQTFYTGPSRREVERVTGTRVPVHEVKNSSRPGRTVLNNNGVNLYRPNLTNSANSRASSRPQRFFSQDEYRSRVANNNQQNTRSGNVNSSRNANAAPGRSQMNASPNQSRTRNQEMVNPNSASDRNVRSNASQNVRSNQRPSRNQEMGSPNSGSNSNVRSNSANTNSRTMQRSSSPQVQRQVSTPSRNQSAPRSSSSVNSSNQNRVQSSPNRSSSSNSGRNSQVGSSSSSRQQPSVSRSSSNSSNRSGSYNGPSSGSSNRSATSGSSISNSIGGN